MSENLKKIKYVLEFVSDYDCNVSYIIDECDENDFKTILQLKLLSNNIGHKQAHMDYQDNLRFWVGKVFVQFTRNNIEYTDALILEIANKILSIWQYNKDDYELTELTGMKVTLNGKSYDLKNIDIKELLLKIVKKS